MAEKLTAQDAIASGDISSDDLLYMVEDPDGTPISKKVTVGTLMGSASVRELIQDHLGDTVFQAGAGMVVTHDDGADTITFAVDGLLEDLDTLGASTTDGEFLVATGAGTLAWESGATARTSLGVAIGSDVQAWDSQLDSLAAIVPGASYMIASDGLGGWERTSFTAFARTLVDDASASTARTTLGLGTANSPTFTGLTLSADLVTTSTIDGVDIAALSSAYTTHASSDGSDHSYIDQSVVSGASPTFVGTNITGVPAASILAGTFGSGSFGVTADFAVGGKLTFGPGSYGASAFGQAYTASTAGVVLVGATGSAYDFGVYTPAGSQVIRVPTGTANVEFYGAVSGITTLTATTFSGSGASLTNIPASAITAGTFGSGAYTFITDTDNAVRVTTNSDGAGARVVGLNVAGSAYGELYLDGSFVAINTSGVERINVTNTTATFYGGPTINSTTVSATTLAGTLSTAAQPNVTSVGTLTGLTVSAANPNVKISSTTDNAYLTLDSGTDGLGVEESGIFFKNNGGNRWLISKIAAASDDFRFYSYSTASAVLQIGYTGGITVDTDLTLASGSITSSSGAISFGNENLSTTGTGAFGTGTTIGTTSVFGGWISGPTSLGYFDIYGDSAAANPFRVYDTGNVELVNGGTITTTGAINGWTLASTHINLTGASTAFRFFQVANTSGSAYFGIEGSTPGGFFTGSAAYSTVIYSNTQPVKIMGGGTSTADITTFSAGGVAIGGTLSAGAGTFAGAVTLTDGTLSVNTTGAVALQLEGGRAIRASGTIYYDANHASGSHIFRTGTGFATALTLDSSQNATFAGDVHIGSVYNWKSLDSLYNVRSTTGGDLVGFAAAVIEGTNNIRSAWFVDDTNLRAVWDTTYSTGAIEVAIQIVGMDALSFDTGRNATFAGDVGMGVAPTLGRLEVEQGTDSSAGGVTVVSSARGGTLRMWVDGTHKANISANAAGTGTLLLNASNSTFAGDVTATGGVVMLGPSNSSYFNYGAGSTYIRASTTGQAVYIQDSHTGAVSIGAAGAATTFGGDVTLSAGEVFLNGASANSVTIGTGSTTGLQKLYMSNTTSNLRFGLAGGGSDILSSSVAGEIILANTGTYGILFGTSNTEVARLNSAGSFIIGDTANANMTVGLTINQGANDDEIFALKSSDVAHGMTAVTETDTYGSFKKLDGGSGGLAVYGFGESVYGIQVVGAVTSNNSTKTTSGIPAVYARAYKKSGTGVGANDAGANLFGVTDYGTTVFIVDKEGDFHYDGADGGAFDKYDDAALLRTFAIATSDPASIIRTEFDDFLKYNEDVLCEIGVLGAPVSEGGLVNGAQLNRVMVGAIGQNNVAIKSVEDRLALAESELAEQKALVNTLQKQLGQA